MIESGQSAYVCGVWTHRKARGGAEGLYHAEPLPALVDGPQQRVHQLLVALVVGQAQLVEARVRRGQRAERRRRRDLEARVQLLRTARAAALQGHNAIVFTMQLLF